MSWKLLHLGPESESVVVGGTNIWAKPWKSQGENPITVKHPAYSGQEHELNRYFIEVRGKTQEFAAGEVSPGVWLIYLPARPSEHPVLLHLAIYSVGTVGCFVLFHGFEHSPKYVVLGSILLAIAFGAEWYAKSKRRAMSDRADR